MASTFLISECGILNYLGVEPALRAGAASPPSTWFNSTVGAHRRQCLWGGGLPLLPAWPASTLTGPAAVVDRLGKGIISVSVSALELWRRHSLWCHPSSSAETDSITNPFTEREKGGFLCGFGLQLPEFFNNSSGRILGITAHKPWPLDLQTFQFCPFLDF